MEENYQPIYTVPTAQDHSCIF